MIIEVSISVKFMSEWLLLNIGKENGRSNVTKIILNPSPKVIRQLEHYMTVFGGLS